MRKRIQNMIVKERFNDGYKLVVRQSPEIYEDFENALKEFKDIRRIELMAPISKGRDLNFLSAIPWICEIHISAMTELVDFDGILECEHLNKISLGQRTRFDCSFLKKLRNLKEFISTSNLLVNSDSLGEMVQFKKLEIWGLKKDDLTLFQNLENLEYLRVWDGSIKSTDGIDRLENLLHLDLGRSKLKDAEAIGGLKNLSWLCLDYCSKLEDLGFLAQLTFLKQLSINHMKQLCSSNFIAEMIELEVLSAVGTLFVDKNFDHLKNLPHLKACSFDKRNRKEIDALKLGDKCKFSFY